MFGPRLAIVYFLVCGALILTPFVLYNVPISNIISGRWNGLSNFGTSAYWLFPNLHSLIGNSTIVVVGTYNSVEATYVTSDNHNISRVVITVFAVSVTYLKGSGPSNIYVQGTPLPPSDPLPITGQKFVLFLKAEIPCPAHTESPCYNSPTPPSQTFIPTGGVQGKFQVINGLVFGMKTLYPIGNEWLKVDANGTPLDEFIAAVRSS